MRACDPIGYAADLAAKTAAVCRANPRHAARITGARLYTGLRPEPIVHRITVHNLATGERTVERVTPVPKPPSPQTPSQAVPLIKMPGHTIIRGIKRRPTPEQREMASTIVDVVCRTWDISKHALFAPSHKPAITYPRFAAVRLMYERITWSMRQVSQVFNWADHSPVVYALQSAAALLEGRALGKRPIPPHIIADWQTKYAAAVAALDASK